MSNIPTPVSSMLKARAERPLLPLLGLVALLAVASGLAWFAWTAVLWGRLHPHLPWRDVIVILEDLLPILQGKATWADWMVFFEPHYKAHRIALPRALVALDMNYLSGQNHPLYTAAWLSLFSCLFIYLKEARRHMAADSVSWWFCLGISAALLFAPANIWNLLNPINASWSMTFALATASFWLLVRSGEQASTGTWLLAYALATGAALCTFAGVIAWLLLPVLALGAGRKTLLITGLASLALTLAYVNGLASDAVIAQNWQDADGQLNDSMRQAGDQALANNTVSTIVAKASALLAWPLSDQWPLLAHSLVVVSGAILAYYWLICLGLIRNGNKVPRWLILSLLLATLCIGVALAVQLGRVIEQPNHIHGPSYERYNTIVAIYWMAVCGLILANLGQVSDRLKLAVTAGLYVAVLVLIAPTGDYLKQEVLSLEQAMRLYAQGESPSLRKKTDRAPSRFKPEYLFHFDTFFRSNKLSYYAGDSSAPEATSVQCKQDISFTIEDKNRKRTPAKVEVHRNALSQWLIRDMVITDSPGTQTRISLQHQGDYTPYSLINPAANAWLGELPSGKQMKGEVVLVTNHLAGSSFHCRIPEHSAVSQLQLNRKAFAGV